MVLCRKCAYVLDEGELPERCPNCGTPTRVPVDNEPGRALAPRKTSSGTPLASIRRPSAPLDAALPSGGLPTRTPPSAPAAPPPAVLKAVPPPVPKDSLPEPTEDDLPAPVPTTRPFVIPRVVSEQRISIPPILDATRDLENSAELDLPHPNDASAVHPPMLLDPPQTRSDDVDVDLNNIQADRPDSPPSPPEVPAHASTPRAPRLPPPRTRRAPVSQPLPAAPAPTAAAYAGLLGLSAALVAIWWVYFSRGPETSLLASTLAHVSPGMSDGARDAERREAFAAQLDADTVEGYLAAQALAEQHGDELDRAEAALRIDLRYGPDPVRAAQAAALLDAATHPRDEARAARVRALAALTRGDLATARDLLARAADPWVDLYRGFVAYQAGDHASAAQAASQAMSQRPGDQAARWLTFAAELAADRRASLDPLRAEADHQPDRLNLQTLLIDALIARGRFTEARKRLEALSRPPGISDANHARVLLQNARVTASAVEVSRSLYWAEEAMRQTPNDPAVLRAALRVLIEADELARAQQGLAALLRASPHDVEAHVLQAELALRAGNEGAATRAIERLAAQPKTAALAHYFRGRLALASNRLDEAAQAFQAAAAADPPHVLAAIEAAKLKARAGGDGLAALDRLFEDRQRDPTEAARADLRALSLARANLLAEAGKREQAIAALDAALARDSDDNAAQLRRGVLALEAGRTDAGRVDLLAVYERTGGFPGLVGPMSRLYIRSGELKALEAMLQPQLNDARAPDEVVLAVAQLRLAQDSVENADLMADNVLLRNPGSWEAHLIKSRVQLARGDLQLAQAELRLARPKQPDPEVELTAGKLFERSGRPQEALAAYRKAHQLAPTLHEATFLHGRMLLQLGRPQDAIAELSAVTKATESFPAAFLALGQAFHDRGNLDEAHRNFQRAALLAPSLAEAHYWLGRCEAERKEYAAALAALGRAVRNAEADPPWLADAYLWLGRAAEAEHDTAAARAAFESHLRLAPAKSPGRAEAERQLARLGRAP